MYLLVEANTDRGRRRFIIGSDSGLEAEALMRTFVDEDDRIMDESGEWFEASQIDVASIVPGDFSVGRSGTLNLAM